MKCIVRTSQEFLKLVEETNLSPIMLDMRIGKWQEVNNSDEFPSAEEILNYTKSTPEVNMVMKSVTILQSSKGDEVFRKGDKNNWTIDKMLQELQVPKEQQELIKSFNTRNREEILTSLLANYSYTVEINTAKTNEEKQVKQFGDNEEFTFAGSIYEYKNNEYLKDGDIIDLIEYETAKHESFTTPNTAYYSNLTVPGGTNYTENEIATPLITPAIKGHAAFSTDSGIGWFRTDDRSQTQNIDLDGEFYDSNNNRISETEYIKLYGTVVANNIPTKTRRILEVQSDLFQKGRDKENLTVGVSEETRTFELNNNKYTLSSYTKNGLPVGLKNGKEITTEEYLDAYEKFQVKNKQIINQNQFLQLLNKDNNWVSFFVKSIIQDSAKKGYEKVLFPSGDTASKVEGHTTLEEFKREKENRLKELEEKEENNKATYIENEKEIARLSEKLKTYNFLTKNDLGYTYNNEEKTVNLIDKTTDEDVILSHGYWANNKISKNVNTETEAKAIFNRFISGEKIQEDNYFYSIEQVDELKLKDSIERKLDTLESKQEFLKTGLSNEITTLKQELERVEIEGFGALKPIYNFYENTVTNILKKQGFNPVLITDEYGNTWNEVTINEKRDLSPIQYSKGLGQPTATQIRKELSIPYRGSESSLIGAQKRISTYNDKNGTSHGLSKVSLNKANTEYSIAVILNFNPVNQKAKAARKKVRKDPDQYGLFDAIEDTNLLAEENSSELAFPSVPQFVETYKDFRKSLIGFLGKDKKAGKYFVSKTNNKPTLLTSDELIIDRLTRLNHLYQRDIFEVWDRPDLPNTNDKVFSLNEDVLLDLYAERVAEMQESARAEGSFHKSSRALTSKLTEEDSIDRTAEKIAKLKQSFPNAEVIIDGDMPEGVYGSLEYVKGLPVIRLNAKGIQSDTIIHEFGHLFIDSLGGMSNPFIKRGRDLLRGSKIEADVIRVYGSELSGEALDKEILTTAVGIEGANLEKMTPFRQWIKIFFNKLKLALGIRGNVALELAQRMLNNEVGPLDRNIGISSYIQYSKVHSHSGPTSRQDRQLDKVVTGLLDKITIIKHKYKKSENKKFKEDIEEILKELVRAKDAKGIVRYLDKTEALSNKVLSDLKEIGYNDINGASLKNLYTFSGMFEMASDISALMITAEKELLVEIKKATEAGHLQTSEEGIISINPTLDAVTKASLETSLNIYLALKNKAKTLEKVLKNTSDIKEQYDTLSKEFLVQQMKGSITKIKGDYKRAFEAEYNRSFPKSKSGQSSADYSEAKKQYIEDKIQQFAEEIDQETEEYLRKILETAPKDYNNIATWLYDPKSFDGAVISFVTKILEEADYLADREYLDEEITASEILDDYIQYKGATHNMEEFYKDFLETDKSGNLTGYMVGEYHSESGEFNGIPNPQYKKIADLRATDPNHPMIRMYDYLISLNEKKDTSVPEAYKLGKVTYVTTMDGDVLTKKVYKLPSIEKGWMERISEQGLKTTVLEGIKDLYQKDTSYTESGELLTDEANKIITERSKVTTKKIIVDERGRERQDIPIHYRAEIKNKGQQSFDLMGIMLADFHMAKNYEHKSAVRHVAEIALDVVENNDVNKRTGNSIKINALSKAGSPALTPGAQSNLFKILNSVVQQKLYGVSSIDLGDVKINGKDISINKLINGVLKWTGDTLLIGNTLSAPVNLIQGKVYNFIESSSNGFFNNKNFRVSEKLYWSDMKGILDDSLGKRVVGSKTNLFIKRFGAFNEISDIGKKFSNMNRASRLWDRGIGHTLNNSAEHYIQGTVTYAVLDAIKIKNDKGEEVSLHEAYEVKNNRLVAKEGFTIDKQMEAKISSRIKEVIKQLHGNYDNKNLSMIQRHAGGKAAFMLRKWLVPGVLRRWRGMSLSSINTKFEELDDTKLFYSEALEQHVEGYYTSATRYLNQIKGDLFSLRLSLISSKWDELSDYEKSNVRKTIYDAALMITTIIATNILAGLAKDADDEDKETYYRMAYTFRRLQGETLFYINPSETLKILSSPAASISMIKNMTDASILLMTDPTAKYKIGDRKGEYKLQKKGFKLFPVLSQVDRDIMEVYEWLENV